MVATFVAGATASVFNQCNRFVALATSIPVVGAFGEAAVFGACDTRHTTHTPTKAIATAASHQMVAAPLADDRFLPTRMS